MTTMEMAAVDAAANALLAVAGRSAASIIGGKRSRHEDGEGESARDVVMRAGQSFAHTRNVYGVPKSLALFKKLALSDAGSSQWVTYHFGKLTKAPLAAEPITGNLSYLLNYKENQTLPIGPGSAFASNATEYPLHIYSLANREQGTTANYVGHFMYSDGTAGGLCQFGLLQGVLQDGTTTSYGWDVWAASDPTAANNLKSLNMSSTYLKSVDVDILLRGSGYNPVEYVIDVVTFLDDDLGPGSAANPTRDEYFLPLVRPKLGNPMASMPRGPKRRQLVKVLSSYKYFFNPNSTTEIDTTPQQRRVHLNLNFGHRIQWDWTPRTQVYTKLTVDNVNEWKTSYYSGSLDGPTPSTVPPNYMDRVYLVVRASNPYDNNAGATPSYDIRIKPTHVWNKYMSSAN